MKIYAFTLDLKPLPEGDGFKILEVNDLIRSGFEGYHEATGDKMIEDVILPDYRRLFEGFEVLSLLSGAAPPSGAAINLPRSNSCTSYYYRANMVMHHYLPFATVNSDLRFHNFCSSKVMQADIFTRHPALKDLYPRSRAITTFAVDADYAVAALDDFAGDVVVKPDDECGGNGVTILDVDTRHRTLETMLKNTNGKKGPVWCGHHGMTAVIQDLVPPSLIDIDGDIYDATMRVAVTVWQADENAPLQCHVHDAYWKPAAAPYEGIENRDARISFSRSYRDDDARAPTRLFSLRDIFNTAMFGRGTTYRFHFPVGGQQVDPALKEKLFPVIGRAMPTLIETAIAEPSLDRALRLLQSDDHVERARGVSMAMNAYAYPCETDAAGRDNLSMKYPKSLADGMADYIRAHHDGSPQVMNAIAAIFRQSVPIICDDFTDDVLNPVMEALEEAHQRDRFDPMMAVLMRLVR